MYSLIWHPSGERSTFAVLADSHIVLYDLESSGSSARVTEFYLFNLISSDYFNSEIAIIKFPLKKPNENQLVAASCRGMCNVVKSGAVINQLKFV